MTVAADTRMSGDPGDALPASRGRVAAIVLLLALAAGVVLAVPAGFALLWIIPYAAVGSLLVWRRRGAAIGWLLLALGWAHVAASFPLEIDPDRFAAGTLPLHLMVIAVIVGGGGGITMFVLYPTLAFVFPSGHLPAGRWGRLARLALATGVGLIAVSLVAPTLNVRWQGQDTTVPNPFAVAPDHPWWEPVRTGAAFFCLIALFGCGVASLALRFRHATGIERQQLRWVLLAMAAAVIAVLSGFVLGWLIPDLLIGGLNWVPAILAFPLIPLSIGIAVMRYRLFEIDRLVSRTISYALVTATLVAIFAGAIVLLQQLLAPITGGDTVAVAASTLLAASLFQPLRLRTQRVVDRRFDRARYDGERLAAVFAARLRDEVDLATVADTLLATTREALGPRTSGIWLRDGSEVRE